MPHTIKIMDIPPIINIIYRGGITLKDRMEAVIEVCNILPPDIPVLLLVDVSNIKNLMTTVEQEYFGHYLADKPEFKEAKIAVLTKPDVHNPNTIINNIAYLDGYHLVPFTCRSEAIYWLEGSVV